jgi:alpha-beta hydrolase superfamily lysophospholipase
MLQTETIIRAFDATKLLVRHYRPSHGRAARTLLIVHGMAEHVRRYEHIARFIVERGWNLVIPDLRGHGRSGGEPTHVRDFRDYVLDLQSVRRHYRLKRRRTALLGHSMGGLIALRTAQIFPGCAAALVLMSPLLGLNVAIPPLTFTTGRVLSVLAPRTRFRSKLDPTASTSNLQAIEARLQDPPVNRTVTARWFFAMRASLRAAWAEAENVRLPLLLMQSGQDRIVDALASAEWFRSAGSHDKAFHCLEDNLHELHNEPDWERTVSMVLDWLEPRVAPKPLAPKLSGAAPGRIVKAG